MNSVNKPSVFATLFIAALSLTALYGCNSSPRDPSPATSASSPDASASSPSGARCLLPDASLFPLWVIRGDAATYSVSDGVITGTTAPNTTNTFLCTVAEYADFVLELDVKTDPALNSGIQIRSHARPEKFNNQPIERVHGYQIEIDPSNRKWTGGLYDEGGRLWLADLKSNPAAQAAFRQGDWNHLRIHAEGPRIRTWLNGVPAIDYTETAQVEANRSGFIALQVHGVGAKTDPLMVQFKNIFLTPLSKPLTTHLHIGTP